MSDDDNPYPCKCMMHPHNSVCGDTALGDVMRTTLSTNARNPLPLSFVTVTSFPSNTFLAKFPTGTVDVAVLARHGRPVVPSVGRWRVGEHRQFPQKKKVSTGTM
jgi:hypothetical protein